jgi:hypothetical protein
MEHTAELFSLVIFFYIGIGVVGYHVGKSIDRISNKLDTIEDLIRDGINKLDEIELKT